MINRHPWPRPGHDVQQVGTAHGTALQVDAPLHQVTNGRMHLPIAGHFPGTFIQPVGAPQGSLVTTGDLEVQGVLVDYLRPVHRQRFENGLVGELPDALSTDSFNHQREHEVAGIAVGEPSAGGELRLRLHRQQGQGLRLAQWFGVGDALGLGRVFVAGQPAGVMEQMAQGDRVRVAAKLRDVLADGVVQRECVPGGQQVDGERGELFGNRGEVEHRIRAQRFALFNIGKTRCALYDKRILLFGAEHTTGASLLGQALEHFAQVPFNPRGCRVQGLIEMFNRR
ncbi:hypothetical protein D3C79_770850 [compost metagenome]